MPINFDGDNLLITLESGVTEIDVVTDLYKAWKDWMLETPRNRRYPQAFISDGGAPLTAIINQGSYIFLQNQYGWRIKPPEEDITIFLTGNLAVADIALDSIIPTTGNFTAAVIGLQPITQGVIPEMRDQLAYASFADVVTIDQANVTGKAIAGTAFPAGSREFPTTNTTDGIAIANNNGFDTFFIKGDLSLTSVDFSLGFIFRGTNPVLNTVTLVAGTNVTDCEFQEVTISGVADNNNIFRSSRVGNITSFNGYIVDSGLTGTITLGASSSTTLLDSSSLVPGTSTPFIDFNGQAADLAIRGYNGGLTLTNKTNATGNVSLDFASGQCIIDSSCTAGTITVRGQCKVIDENGDDLYPGVINGGLTLNNEAFNPIWANEVHRGTERKVWVDETLIATGYGSQEDPYNNIADALDYAASVGIRIIVAESDITLDRTLVNYKIEGLGDPIINLNGQTLTGTHFSDVTLTGTGVGSVEANNCVLNTGLTLNGTYQHCYMAGDLTCANGAQVNMIDCASIVAGTGRPTISMGNTNTNVSLSVRRYSGGLTVTNSTSATNACTVEVTRGSLRFDATNTAGELVARTAGKFEDLTTGTTVVVNEDYQQQVWQGMELDTNPGSTMADRIWAKPVADFTDETTIGGYLALTVLTIGRFLALK